MPSKTITVTNGDGSTKTITMPDRSRYAGTRTISRVTGGVSHNISVDRTAQVVTSDRKGASRPLLSKVVGGASAAYSLRDLNDKAGNNKVVRVRRASDNCERDFRAKEVKDIEKWVNQQTVLPLDLQELDADGYRTGDVISAEAAYSLRNLSDSYTGNVVDVRRSSDDAEESFTAAEVADGTLTDWVGSGNDGFVSKWYNQSGNGNHAVQTTPASQPKIVDGGSLVSGGLLFDGLDDFFGAPVPLDGATVHTSIVVATPTQASRILSIKEDGRADENWRMFVSGSNDASYGLDNGAAFASSRAITLGNLSLLTGTYDANTLKMFVNGETPTTTAAVSGFILNTTGDLEIGRNANSGGNDYGGKIEEIIIYSTDQSDDRTAIESNMADYYGINLPSGVDTENNEVDGFVETWYDQSGNGNDAVQAVAGSQPKIVNAGSLVSGGIKFDAGADSLNLPSVISSVNSASSFVVAKTTNLSVTQNALSLSRNSPVLARFYAPVVIGGNFYFGYGSNASAINLGSSDTSEHLFTATAGSSTAEGFIDGASGGTISSVDLYSPQSKGGIGDINGTTHWIGTIQEIVIYNTDQSANREAIEANINNQYDIY
jgi:hypothetical protein